MNIAVIDVGSNNIKLEIHDAHTSGNHDLIFSEKLPARLGHEVFITRRLAEENQQIAIDGLRKISSLIEKKNCKKVIVVGTAALREANPDEFVRRVEKETGIKINVISGVEEARLVYYGVRAYTNLENEKFLLIDIGGGSTELSVSDANVMYAVESLRLGSVRLKELFGFPSDSSEVEMTRQYIRKICSNFFRQASDNKFEYALCTGGTARTIAEILKAKGQIPGEYRGLPVISITSLKQLCDDLCKMSVNQIENLPGIEKQRADIILHGALLLHTLLDSAGIRNAMISDKGLRDGIVEDYLLRKARRIFYRKTQLRFRESALDKICRKYQRDPEHARKTAELSDKIFQLLANEYKLDENYRDILIGAGYLHDIGMYIDYSQHHKHSAYIIANSDIPGFSQSEQDLIALISRYHRKSMPKKSHPEFAELSESQKKTVIILALILRLGISLDKGGKGTIIDITINKINKDQIEFGLKTRGDISLELWDLERKRNYLEKYFKRKIKFTV